MPASVAEICRYPVKGLNAESLARVTLTPGQGVPEDRRFAIAHGSTDFDPAAPEAINQVGLFRLVREERLAQLRVHFESETGMLTIERGGRQVARGKATDPMGRTLISQFLAGFLGDRARGAPKLLDAGGHTFSDTPRERYVSLLNLNSLRDVERVARAPVDARRFRANFLIEGLPAWAEERWVGKEIELGGARLRLAEPVERCAATNVNPDTAERDMNIPLLLRRAFRHIHMGVYADVVKRGEVVTGDAVTAPD